MNWSSLSMSACLLVEAAPNLPPAAMLGHCKKSTSSPSASSMANVMGGSPGPHTAANTLTSTSSSAPNWSWSRTSGFHGASATRRHSDSPQSLRISAAAARSRATAASRVSAGRSAALAPASASRLSLFQASAISETSSMTYADSISLVSSWMTTSGSAMRSLISPSRCALSTAPNSAPLNSHAGLPCRRLISASGWNGSIASVPAGVGCVHTQALRRMARRSHARTAGSAAISAAATCTRERMTEATSAYPVSSPT
mmetsp:Transcript_13490/g.58979  ORF Transcript_13490/g.58979 Transcript_13490/m.58979 type:complete len:257 (-) Transcript_13490:1111-1881(-)